VTVEYPEDAEVFEEFINKFESEQWCGNRRYMDASNLGFRIFFWFLLKFMI
jgi:hypothetical protein